MSSTNRSKARESHIADYYVTPLKDIELFLREFDKRVHLDWNNIRIIDPCAGGNNEIRDKNGKLIDIAHPMSYPTAIKNVFGDCNVNTLDIREDSLASVKTDYLKELCIKKFAPNMIITNPPFNLSTQIIEKAIDDVAKNGYVIMLLRLNFFGSKEREKFFSKYMPEYCFVHHIRIGFSDKKDSDGYVILDNSGMPKKGGTDSIEYCHMVFRKGYYPEFTKLIYI